MRDKIKARECNRRYRQKLFKLRTLVWGDECSICHSTKYLMLHKLDGAKHPDDSGFIAKALKNPEEFKRVCSKCHTGIHFCMKHFRFSWEDILKHLQETR